MDWDKDRLKETFSFWISIARFRFLRQERGERRLLIDGLRRSTWISILHAFGHQRFETRQNDATILCTIRFQKRIDAVTQKTLFL